MRRLQQKHFYINCRQKRGYTPGTPGGYTQGFTVVQNPDVGRMHRNCDYCTVVLYRPSAAIIEPRIQAYLHNDTLKSRWL